MSRISDRDYKLNSENLIKITRDCKLHILEYEKMYVNIAIILVK